MSAFCQAPCLQNARVFSGSGVCRRSLQNCPPTLEPNQLASWFGQSETDRFPIPPRLQIHIHSTHRRSRERQHCPEPQVKMQLLHQDPQAAARGHREAVVLQSPAHVPEVQGQAALESIECISGEQFCSKITGDPSLELVPPSGCWFSRDTKSKSPPYVGVCVWFSRQTRRTNPPFCSKLRKDTARILFKHQQKGVMPWDRLSSVPPNRRVHQHIRRHSKSTSECDASQKTPGQINRHFAVYHDG